MNSKNKLNLSLSVERIFSDRNKYRINCDIKSGSEIISKQIVPYKKANGNFNDSKDIINFEGDSYCVDYPGWYTVKVKNADGEIAVQSIRIRNKLLIPITIISILLIAALLFVLLMSNPSARHKKAPSPVSRPIPTSSIVPNKHKAQNTSAARNIVTDCISSAAVFDSHTKGTAGEWAMKNNNNNTVEMQAELFINNQIVGVSQVIKPGQSINALLLTKDIQSGTYKAYMAINYYSLKTQAYINKTIYRITVTAS